MVGLFGKVRESSRVSGRPPGSLVALSRTEWGLGTMHGLLLGGTREAGRACERRWSTQFGSRHCESLVPLAHSRRSVYAWSLELTFR